MQDSQNLLGLHPVAHLFDRSIINHNQVLSTARRDSGTGNVTIKSHNAIGSLSTVSSVVPLGGHSVVITTTGANGGSFRPPMHHRMSPPQRQGTHYRSDSEPLRDSRIELKGLHSDAVVSCLRWLTSLQYGRVHSRFDPGNCTDLALVEGTGDREALGQREETGREAMAADDQVNRIAIFLDKSISQKA
jgi:hypothetical protein